jgi:hypothetical protein
MKYLPRIMMIALLLAPAPARAAQGDCGQPNSSGTTPVASDALGILQAAVGLVECAPATCDVDANCNVTASDALRTLQSVVGLPIQLDCNGNCETAATWMEVMGIFARYGCPGCHGSVVSQGGLGGLGDFDAGYDELVTDGSVQCFTSSFTRQVVPGDPDASFLINKISGSPDCGSNMPISGSPVSEQDIDLISSWIRDSAPKN